jgi:hypothetical protein
MIRMMTSSEIQGAGHMECMGGDGDSMFLQYQHTDAHLLNYTVL